MCSYLDLSKTARYGFLPEWSPKTIDELFESSDKPITLFKAALKNPDHVIHPLLPPPKPPGYNLRKHSHGLILPTTQQCCCQLVKTVLGLETWTK